MFLPISLTLAAAAALLHFWLSLRIVQLRRAEKIAHGDGGHPLLARRMRAHANFVESGPFIVILVALIELSVGSQGWLWVAAVLFVLARIVHAMGMEREGMSQARMGGAVVTFLLLIGLALTAAWLSYGAGRQVPPASIGANA